MLNHNIDFDSDCSIREQFLESNAVTIGALAWRGYQLKNRGAVVVYALEHSVDSLEESLDVEIGYLSREEVLQNYPEEIGLFQFVDEYDPQNELVITFANGENSLGDSYCLTLALQTLKCYALLQERMLELAS